MFGASHALPTGDTTQACTLTGNQTGDPLVHRLALNLLSRTRQGCFHIFLSGEKQQIFLLIHLLPNSHRRLEIFLFPLEFVTQLLS